jgi:hypothetical protein
MLKIAQLVVVFTFLPRVLIGQVMNNDISSRSQLILDQSPTISTTNNSTVEWQCVNRKLTNKCLVYHNDQWFTFTPSANGKYYINLSAGSCRDNRGIQAIVIQGNPCEINSYKIKKCIPQIRFEDSFIELDSMLANTTYLVNIDGFLGDYCQFSIQFGSNSHGVSVDSQVLRRLDLSVRLEGAMEILRWKLPLNLKDSIRSFAVYRKPDQRHIPVLRALIPLALNTKGEFQAEYIYADSTPGRRPYGYQIVADMHDNRQVVLDEFVINGGMGNGNSHFRVSFNLDYRDKSKLQIQLIDAIRDVILGQRIFIFNEALDQRQTFLVEEYVGKGINNFKVLIVDLKTRRKREMLFFVDNNGKVSVR